MWIRDSHLLVFSQEGCSSNVEDTDGSRLKPTGKDLIRGMVGDGCWALFGGREVIQLNHNKHIMFVTP